MRILLTGSTGFVGSYILDSLEGRYELILPVRNKEKLKKEIPNATITSFKEPLSDIVIKYQPDIVINTLGILIESKNITFEKVHVEYVRQLVEGSVKSSVKKFIHISALGADKNSKSRYAKTKAEAEEIIMSSGLNYLILRPSIILGKGQKLFDDLRKLSLIAPLLFAPKGKVQPVHIDDVVDVVLKGVENGLDNEIIELCGNRIVSYKELFQFALGYIGRKRPVFEIPISVLQIMVPFMQILPEPPVTQDQIYLLEKDNVCTGKLKTQKDILGSVRNPFKF